MLTDLHNYCAKNIAWHRRYNDICFTRNFNTSQAPMCIIYVFVKRLATHARNRFSAMSNITLTRSASTNERAEFAFATMGAKPLRICVSDILEESCALPSYRADELSVKLTNLRKLGKCNLYHRRLYILHLFIYMHVIEFERIHKQQNYIIMFDKACLFICNYKTIAMRLLRANARINMMFV